MIDPRLIKSESTWRVKRQFHDLDGSIIRKGDILMIAYATFYKDSPHGVYAYLGASPCRLTYRDVLDNAQMEQLAADRFCYYPRDIHGYYHSDGTVEIDLADPAVYETFYLHNYSKWSSGYVAACREYLMSKTQTRRPRYAITVYDPLSQKVVGQIDHHSHPIFSLVERLANDAEVFVQTRAVYPAHYGYSLRDILEPYLSGRYRTVEQTIVVNRHTHECVEELLKDMRIDPAQVLWNADGTVMHFDRNKDADRWITRHPARLTI
jgi:hypothetical protein